MLAGMLLGLLLDWVRVSSKQVRTYDKEIGEAKEGSTLLAEEELTEVLKRRHLPTGSIGLESVSTTTQITRRNK